jgi:hypothetical protein
VAQALLVLAGQREREKAIAWIKKAPVNTRVVFRGPVRTIPQNERMWACLTDISQQLAWHGMKLSPDDWKLLFLAALGGEMRVVPNIHGNGFVDLGRSSSKLEREEFSNLLAIIQAFAAEHDVTLSDGVTA